MNICYSFRWFCLQQPLKNVRLCIPCPALLAFDTTSCWTGDVKCCTYRKGGALFSKGPLGYLMAFFFPFSDDWKHWIAESAYGVTSWKSTTSYLTFFFSDVLFSFPNLLCFVLFCSVLNTKNNCTIYWIVIIFIIIIVGSHVLPWIRAGASSPGNLSSWTITAFL